MSALPSKADKLADVSLSPLCATSGFVHRSKKFARFSITRSPRRRARRVGGISSPSALAVLRLMAR